MPNDPTKTAERWAQNLAGSTEKMRSNVRALSVSPTQKAASQKAKYLQRIQARVDVWAANLQKITLAEWQAAMEEKAIPRVGPGAAAKQAVMAQFFTQLFSYQQSQLGAINNMPTMTLEDSIAKSAAWIRAMSKFSYKK